MLFLLSLFLYLVAILFIDALKTQDYLIALCCSFLLGMIFMKCIDAIIFITRIGIERFAWFIENKNLIYHLPQNNDWRKEVREILDRLLEDLK